MAMSVLPDGQEVALAEFTANPGAFGLTSDGDALPDYDVEAAEDEVGDECGAFKLRFKFQEAVSHS